MPPAEHGGLGQIMCSFEFHAGLEFLLAENLPWHEFWDRVDEYFAGAAPRLERWIACLESTAPHSPARLSGWSETAASRSALRLCQRWHEISDPTRVPRGRCLQRLVKYHQLHAEVHREIARALTGEKRETKNRLSGKSANAPTGTRPRRRRP
jgi:hypothetical protein